MRLALMEYHSAGAFSLPFLLKCKHTILTKYNYNLANKLLTLSNENGTTVFAGYTYTYYLNGNQATKTDNNGDKM